MNISQQKLNKMLNSHEKWLNGDVGGEQFKANRMNLANANLGGANLVGANLVGADLRFANLRFADLEGANLVGADLEGANLGGANLRFANLRFADLEGANLVGADLEGANLEEADLGEANLGGANLEEANLCRTILSNDELCRLGIILEKPIIGFKKCRNGVIVKLQMPKGAIVFSINNSKCRTDKAKVLELIGGEIGVSQFNENFIYEKGKTYTIDNFNMQYNIECSTGIHFFKTLKEAENFDL